MQRCTTFILFYFLAACSGTSETSPFCVDGRLAPSVFVVGCQKCGTTSLVADMLSQLPLTCGSTLPGEPRKLWKEKHFFDNGECKFNRAACYNESNSVAPAAGFNAARAHFLSHYPKCSAAAPFPAGAAAMDATPRYMRVPMVPHRIRALYGPELSNKLKIVVILRDPETRAWSWFRFFALNACEGKLWATDQLERRFWFHYNDGSFGRWVQAQVDKLAECSSRGLAQKGMWPHCDSETGLFAGLYSLQIRHWIAAGFDPSQVRGHPHGLLRLKRPCVVHACDWGSGELGSRHRSTRARQALQTRKLQAPQANFRGGRQSCCCEQTRGEANAIEGNQSVKNFL